MPRLLPRKENRRISKVTREREKRSMPIEVVVRVIREAFALL